MAESTYSRKLDTAGRIMIPVKLREKVNMIVGKEYDFIYLEHDGRKYICIDCGPIGTDEEVKKAIQLLRAKGFKISDIGD